LHVSSNATVRYKLLRRSETRGGDDDDSSEKLSPLEVCDLIRRNVSKTNRVQCTIHSPNDHRTYSVILQQTVSNAAGPDTMDLHEVSPEGRKACIDLYQEKFWKQSHEPAQLHAAATTLGICINEDILPDSSSDAKRAEEMNNAEDTEKSLQQFTEFLKRGLRCSNVDIRDRVIVMKKRASELKNETIYQKRLKQVKIWTSDFLEPTFATVPTDDDSFGRQNDSS